MAGACQSVVTEDRSRPQGTIKERVHDGSLQADYLIDNVEHLHSQCTREEGY